MTNRRGKRGGGFLTLAVLMLVPAVVLSQSSDIKYEGTSDRPTSIRETVRVDLVLTEVVVLDKKGRHVTGLPRDLFRVVENGVELPVLTFDEIDWRTNPEQAQAAAKVVAESAVAPVESPTADAAATQELAAPRVDPRGERKFIFVFDGYNNPSPLRLVQARREAMKFARNHMGPGDVGALYEIAPYIRNLVGFTADLGELEKGLEEVRYFPGESLGTQIVDSTVYSGMVGSRDDIENNLRRNVEFGAEQSVAEQRIYFQSFQALGNILEVVPGRKFVLWFSGGFPMVTSSKERADLGYSPAFKSMMAQLERADTRVYGFDIGDEVALLDAEDRSSYRQILDEYGFNPGDVGRVYGAIGAAAEYGSGFTQIMAVISHGSGGRFFPGKDYERNLGAVNDDSQHYYLIGYESQSDGLGDAEVERYRKVRIEVDDKVGRVVAKKGRFLRKSSESTLLATSSTSIPAEPAQGGAGDLSSEPDEDSEVRHELFCSPVLFPGPPGRTLVALPIFLSGPVKPIQLGDNYDLDISLVVVVRSGEHVFDQHERTFRSTIDTSGLDTLLRGVRMTDAIELPPGAYDFAVELRLNGLGVEASWHAPVEVKGFAGEQLQLSSVAILPDESAAPLIGDVFLQGGEDEELASIAESDPFKLVNEWRVLGSGTDAVDRLAPLTVFFRVYHPRVNPDSGKPEGLMLDYLLEPDDGGAKVLPPVELVYFKGARDDGAFDVLARLDLRAMEAGAYRLQVVARQDDADRRAAESHPVLIASPSKILN
jgi:VWFA-related protein